MDATQRSGEHEATLEGNPARLQVAGVQTPILTRITRKSARGMTVEQELPFLQLHTQVWDDARQGSRIESVSVVVYDGMPRLVLDLAYDDAPSADAGPMQFSQSAVRAHAGVVRPRVRPDRTQPFDLAPSVVAAMPAACAAPVASTAAAAPVAPRSAVREPSTVFSTQGGGAATKPALQSQAAVSGLKLSVMEQELLQPKDFVFHVKTTWQTAKPHIRRAGWQAQALSFRAYRWSKPRLVALMRAALALTVRGTRSVIMRVRKRAQPAVLAAATASTQK